VCLSYIGKPPVSYGKFIGKPPIFTMYLYGKPPKYLDNYLNFSIFAKIIEDVIQKIRG